MSQTKDSRLNKEDVDNLILDVEYLVYELEALKSVISDVEYNDAPPGSYQLSILDKLRSLGYVQKNYYEELIRKVVYEDSSKITLKREEVLKNFADQLEHEEKDNQDIDKVLSEIIEQRKGLIDRLIGFEHYIWEQQFNRVDSDADGESNIYLLIKELVSFERSELKEIAERVQIMSLDREQQRQMKANNK